MYRLANNRLHYQSLLAVLQSTDGCYFYTLCGYCDENTRKIRFMRESRHWSQEEMADKLGMSTNGYAKIERGETRAFIPKLEQIAEAFEVDLMELLSFGEKNFFAIGDSNNGFCNITGSSELAFEIQKLQLVVSHKDELLSHQKQEIANLHEMIALLKGAKSA